MTDFTYVDTSSPNFRHGAYMPDDPNFSGTTSAVLRMDKHGNLLTSNVGAPTTLLSGTTSTGTTPAALGSSTVMKKVTVQANYANGYFLLIGNSSVQEVRLDAGESVDIEVDDLNKVYFRTGSTGAEIVEVAYLGS